MEGACLKSKVWPRSQRAGHQEAEPQRHQHVHRPRDRGWKSTIKSANSKLKTHERGLYFFNTSIIGSNERRSDGLGGKMYAEKGRTTLFLSNHICKCFNISFISFIFHIFANISHFRQTNGTSGVVVYE